MTWHLHALRESHEPGRADGSAGMPSCHSGKSVCDQRKPIATDDLDPITFPHPGPRALSDRLSAPVVEPYRDHIVGFLFRVFLDLVAGIGACACAHDGGSGVTASRADLMAEHPAEDPAGNRPDAAAFALLHDVANRFDHAASRTANRRWCGC